MAKVSIATKPLVYSTFRYIANTAWNALAEYVDNSLQSFIAHKEKLSQINEGGKLRVDIHIDDNEINITDNAWGIEADNYQRAFELANIPLDASGLSEFGMGMKVSSIWFSDVWKVETCALGDGVKKTVVFDINEVIDHQETSLNVDEQKASPTEHYTRITLKQLSQNRPKQLAAVKRHLASTYTKFIRDGVLELVINGEVQQVSEPKVLVAPYHKRVGADVRIEGEEKEWKVDISFCPKNSKYKVTGFIGVLETMSTDKENGFLIFRRGRAIGHSGDDKYRPYALCGQVGSPQYKRIFGELSVEGFDVSFQKNAFQEDEAFTLFIEDLAEDLHDKIKKHQCIDVFGQASNFKKDRTAAEIKKTSRRVADGLARVLSKPIIINTSDKNIDKPVQENPNVVVQQPPKEVRESAKYQKEIDMVIDNQPIKLTIKTKAEGQKQGLYELDKNPDGTYTTTINLSNAFFDSYGNDDEDLDKVVYFIKVLIQTELSMQMASRGTFRNRFNNFFGEL